MDVAREAVLPSSIDDVWDALTDPARIGEWFGAEVTGTLVPGGVLTFKDRRGERRALVEAVHAPRKLVFRWLPYRRDGDGLTQAAEPSRVELSCVEEAGGTRLRIVETRVDAAVDPFPTIGFRPLARAGRRHA